MDNQFASLLPAVENYLKLAEDFHSYLSEGEASGKDFATICTQFDSIRKDLWDVIISHEDNIPENSMQTTYNVSNTWVRNFIATFEYTVEDFLNDPATKSLNEAEKRIVLDELFKALIKHLHTWIGDVIYTQNMANNNRNNVLYSGINELEIITSKIEKDIYDPANTAKLYADLCHNVNVAPNNSDQIINTVVSININELNNLGLSDIRLNPFDREVHDVICTLYDYGHMEISPGMIYRILSGNKKKGNIMNKEMREMILNSVLKMMGTIITINAKAEVDAGYLTTQNKTKFEGIYREAIIPAKTYEFSINGHLVKDGILLLDTPPIFHYAAKNRAKAQISRVCSEILNTPLRNTPENIKLRGYFIRMIEALTNPNNHFNNPDVLYETLEKYLQITAPNKNALRVKKSQLRSKVKKLLDYWVKIGYILSYGEIEEKSKERNISSVRKIRIYAEKKKPSK